ncbi:MAG: 2-C-methyl-D-erythritol 4-phosphate cytidylyltransferase [Bacteroidetes bacterium]|nr:2-C-methyl-D-erythritol 4-phosphate cytidylyltransferase [Bacteroidota bacterium]
MGSGIPKQFLPINGIPVLFHTIRKFEGIVDEIILVLPASHFTYWNELCEKYSFKLNIRLVEGGDSRTKSVIHGLNAIKEAGIIAIHDAVRPLVSRKLISYLLKEAELHGNAIPAIPVRDSLRKKNGDQNTAVNRSEYFSVQTPQCFQYQIIKTGYENCYGRDFSDDASVIDYGGGKINLVEGEISNIKITFREDILFAEALLNATEM